MSAVSVLIDHEYETKVVMASVMKGDSSPGSKSVLVMSHIRIRNLWSTEPPDQAGCRESL